MKTITDEKLIEALTSNQRAAFEAGTLEEQEKALAHLRLKFDLEHNDAIVAYGAN